MRRDQCDQGFSLVEVVIAMLILGLIAIALLPPLWQGIQFSSEQSTVATATRQLNAIIEEARNQPSCTGTGISTAAASKKYRDGSIVTSDPYDFQTTAAGFSCTAKTLVTLDLTATNMSGKVLASVSAKIYASG